jgi:hypothetical protein
MRPLGRWMWVLVESLDYVGLATAAFSLKGGSCTIMNGSDLECRGGCGIDE